MKRCKECGIEKSHDEFYVYRHDGHLTLYARCKDCHRARIKRQVPAEDRRRHRRNHRKNVWDRINEAKDVPCADCGIKYPPYVMDFDHITGDKVTNIAKMIGRYSIEKILLEIAKCEVVCSNCHRQRTWDRK